MADLFENPMGLDGFEFVEFASPVPGVLEDAFSLLGFTEVARHRSKDVTLWRQGDINFIINNEEKSQAWYFAREQGTQAGCAARRYPNRPDGTSPACYQRYRRCDCLSD
jgi:4-hydroxyphenylpyruvate dioxygenase